MTLGALVDAGVDLADLNQAIGSLGLSGCRLVAEAVKKNGFRATQVTVEYQPEHVHRHLADILGLIDASVLSIHQRESARRIFIRLAEAEAKVHGTTIDKVHFHEVGAVDSIADIVGAAVGFDLLGVERIVASPVPTGSGKIKISHGECSVPAPATAELLRGIPLAESSITRELTTPTGAAILATMVDGFGPLPSMRIAEIGCGAGRRDLHQQPNLLRLIVGESVDSTGIESDDPSGADRVWVLETNLDDTSGELIGYCTSLLWNAGALDVYTTGIQMKKNRPGVKLSVLCREGDIRPVEAILFAETATLGVRRWPVSRNVLDRRPHQVQTEWGPIDGKIGWLSGEPSLFSPEFESCRRVAAERGVPLREVYEMARRAFDVSDSG